MTHVEQTNKRQDIIAFGYVRQCQTLLPNEMNPYFNIPDLVTYIILEYIALTEQWNPELKGDDFDLYIEGEFNNICGKRGNGGYQSIFGTILIESGCHEWKFKLHETNTFSYAFIIGITKHSRCQSVVNSYITSNSVGWAWSASSNAKLLTGGSEGNDYGKCVEADDEITMIFNFDEGILKFIVNGTDHGLPAFDKVIDKTQKYRMGVTFYSSNRIEILNYRQMK